MHITPQMEKELHQKLPIDEDEKILAVYKHHWFAYFSLLLLTLFLVVAILGTAAFLLLASGDTLSSQAKSAILAGAALLGVIILMGGMVPVYLKSQERLVLTDEALLQMLQPAIMATKIEQLGLNDLANISVHNDFFGSLLGYSHLSVETPGEQDNYLFKMLPNAQEAAREIAAAHENFEAALNAGMLKTTFGKPQETQQLIDPAKYQEFLKYQAMVDQQKQSGQKSDDNPS